MDVSEKLYWVVSSRRHDDGQDDERVLGQGSAGNTLWHPRVEVTGRRGLARRLTAAEATARALEEQENDDRNFPEWGWRTWVEVAT